MVYMCSQGDSRSSEQTAASSVQAMFPGMGYGGYSMQQMGWGGNPFLPQQPHSQQQFANCYQMAAAQQQVIFLSDSACNPVLHAVASMLAPYTLLIRLMIKVDTDERVLMFRLRRACICNSVPRPQQQA